MHKEAAVFLLGVAAVMPSPRSYVVEFGARVVNGTARSYLPHEQWYGIDLVDGPGVDEVCPAELWVSPIGRKADMVVCCEVLEHTDHAPEILHSAYHALLPGGVFIITCAGPDRTPHGADGRPHPAPGEWYRGVNRRQLLVWLRAMPWDSVQVTYGPEGRTDVYAVAVRNSNRRRHPCPPSPTPGGPPYARGRA